MLLDKLHATRVLLVVMAGGLLASCATPMQSLSSTNVPTVEVTVTGVSQQLAAFDQALRPLLGAEPVACTVNVDGKIAGCEVLQTSPLPSTAKDLTYDFFGPHTWVFDRLGVAFNQVQSQSATKLTMTTSAAAPVSVPDCSGAPRPCVASPWCPQYGGCSKQSYPCARC